MRILLRNKTVGGGHASSVHSGTEQNAQQNASNSSSNQCILRWYWWIFLVKEVRCDCDLYTTPTTITTTTTPTTTTITTTPTTTTVTTTPTTTTITTTPTT